MSRYFTEPGNVREHRAGIKRTYESRSKEDSHRSSSGSPSFSQTLYTNGLYHSGAGTSVKRPASQSFYYTGLPKMVRMDGVMRSSSTSSIASTMSSSSHNSHRGAVPSSMRTVSLSEVETTRTNKSDMQRNVKMHEPSKTVTSKGKHKQSHTDVPSNSKNLGKKTEKEKSPGSEKRLRSDLEESADRKEETDKIDPKISDEMSRKIWSYYVENKQTKVEEAVKEELRLKIQACINELYPHSFLILGGSSLNGFGAKGCDADLCLYLSELQISQQYSRQILVQLRGHLQQRCSFVTGLKVIFAKVPILKFRHRYRNLECDLNINHHTGVRNTLLLQMYSRLDWRVAPLVMLIKQWAKSHGINDASQGTLSSYSYVLMIINYLQVGCKPPVLSSVHLQDWGARLFAEGNGMQFCWNKMYDCSLPVIRNQSDNSQDLFSLLKGFFAYYASFKFESTVISVRLGSCYPTALLPPNHHGWKQKFIFIEEPFDRVNTARSVFDWMRFRLILETFDETHHMLCKSDNLDLDRFLNL